MDRLSLEAWGSDLSGEAYILKGHKEANEILYILMMYSIFQFPSFSHAFDFIIVTQKIS